MMADLENNINLKKNGLTLKIEVNHQGKVTENRFFEILDLEKKGHTMNVCDLEFQGQPSRSRNCFQHS